MTRRTFVAALAAVGAPGLAPVVIPLHRIADSRAPIAPDRFRRFWWGIWPEAVREFAAAGIRFQVTDGPGEIRRSAAGRPLFSGLRRDALNLMLTDHIPADYRALAGVTTTYEGCHLCLIALRYAHPNRIPFLDTNTCVHELLHALLGDIFAGRAKGLDAGGREWRVDYRPTQLWLGGDGAAVRDAARRYLARARLPL